MNYGNMSYHNSGNSSKGYSAGMDMSATHRKNMNMIGRASRKSVPSGIGRGVMPKISGVPTMGQRTASNVNYTAEMNNAKSKNVNGYNGKGKVTSGYNPMSDGGSMSSMLRGY